MSSPGGPNSYNAEAGRALGRDMLKPCPDRPQTVRVAGFQQWARFDGHVDRAYLFRFPRVGTLQQRAEAPAAAKWPRDITAACREPRTRRPPLAYDTDGLR